MSQIMFPRYASQYILPAALLALASPLRAASGEDDTFADLQRPGRVVPVAGNHGYRTFTLMTWEDGTKIDARGAHWSSFSWGRDIRHPTVNDTTRSNYPIQLGADWVGAFPVRKDLYNDGRCPPPRPEKLYFIGGVLEGTQPISATWKESKAANGGGSLTALPQSRNLWVFGISCSSSAFMQNGIVEVQVQPCSSATFQNRLAENRGWITQLAPTQRLASIE